MPPANKSGIKSKSTREDIRENDLPPFFTPQRIKRLAGLGLIFFSVFLLLALISYCFNWQNDQGNVVNPSWDILFSKTITVENMMGRLGAFLSHVFMYNLFGLGAFVLPYLFFTFGTNATFSVRIFPLVKVMLRVCIGLILIPLFAQFLFPDAEFSVGGGMGKMLYGWLSTLFGRLGLGILLFGGLTTYILWQYRLPLYKFWLNYQKEQAEKRKTERNNIGGESIIPEDKPAPVPHFKDAGFDVVNAAKQTTAAPEIPLPVTPALQVPPVPKPAFPEVELTPYEEPEPITFTTKTIEPVQDNDLPFDPDPEEENIFETSFTPPPVKKAARPQITEPEEALTLEVEVTPVEKTADTKDKSSTAEKSFTPFDHTLELSRFRFPPLDLLADHGGGEISIDKDDLENKKNQIVETLLNYNISIEKIKATVGPTVTLYEIVPSAGIRISKIKNLEDDIALSLAALGIRIIAPIPGKGTIGIEVPNIKKAVVSMKSMLASDKFQNADMDLPVAIGKTIANEHYIADLAKMPHLLMAGATGQGKSVGLNALLVSLLYKKHPTELKLVLVDPKKVELTLFKKIEKYYLAKLPNEEEAIITDTKKVINTLNALCIEMDQRYELLKAAMVRNIKEYNQKMKDRKLSPLNGHRYLPYIVLVVDEFADLMMTAGKEVEMPIARLAQLARAIGIHLVIATQRPSVNIITGVIKANFPGRIAFKVASKIDSRTILDAGGADQLIGRGDLLLSLNSDIIRLQCPFVDTPEVESIANFIEDQDLPCETYELPEYIDPKENKGDSFDDDPFIDRDPMFDDAARLIVLNQVGSTSLIQRKMSLGYNRAGRLMDQLEAAKIVGPNLGSKAREVLVKTMEELEQILQGYDQ